jgi:hypothetical protein
MAIPAFPHHRSLPGEVRADLQAWWKKESLAIQKRKGISEMKDGFGQGGKDTPPMIAVIHLISVLKV